MKHAILVSLIISGSTTFAADRSVTCGDHWFKVSAGWKKGETKATAGFSGDSQPNRSVICASVKEKDGETTITFQDAAGGSLRVDKNGDGHLKESKNDRETGISPCSVD